MSDQSVPMNVGLVELSDDAIEVLGQYTRDPNWHVAVVASSDRQAKAARMAGLLDATLVEEPNVDDLSHCRRVVLGHPKAISRSMMQILRSMGVEIFIWNGEEVTERADSTEGTNAFVSDHAAESVSGFFENWNAGEAPPMEDELDEDDAVAEEAWNEDEEDVDQPENSEPMDVEEEPAELDAEEPAAAPRAEPDEERLHILTEDDLVTQDEFVDESETPEEEVAVPKPDSKKTAPKLKEVTGGSRGWSWDVDEGHPELQGLLDGLRESTEAQTASIMLPNADGSKLRLVGSLGFQGEMGKAGSELNRGLAWDCYQCGEPQYKEAVVPGFAETGAEDRQRVSLSVPIIAESRVMGVVSINLDTEASAPVSRDQLIDQVVPFADHASRVLIKTVSFEGMDADACCQSLMQIVDRIMSFDENLAVRLQDAGDVIAQALRGDYANVLLLDPMGHKLEWVTPRQGLAGGTQRMEADRGFLGWVLRQETPQVLEAVSRDGRERRGNAYMPILSEVPCGLVVLENLKMGTYSRDELLHILENVGGLLGEVLNVEEGMGTQELLSDLKMRIADASSSLESASDEERTQGLLELAVDLTAGCTAMWIPSAASRPVMPKPTSEEARRILGESVFLLDALIEVTEEAFAWSWQLGETDGPNLPEGSEAPAPFLAVREEDGPGTLVVFFPGEDAKTFSAQVPLESMYDVMGAITQLMARRKAA